MRAALQLERGDRLIKRTHVRLSDRAPRQRIALSMQEALRLVDLPGENEGRIYYFRSIALSNLPADGNRKIWLEGFQRVMGNLARAAIHASDHRAGSANAVFFHNRQEALELLLGKLLRDERRPEWFWRSIGEGTFETSRGMQIASLIEELCEQPTSWATVAEIVFVANSTVEPVNLLQAVPLERVNLWLRQLGPGEIFSSSPVLLPKPLVNHISRARDLFGENDLRTLWLAALAAIFVSPAVLTKRTAVQCASAVLRQCSPKHQARLADNIGLSKTDSCISHRRIEFDNSSITDQPPVEYPIAGPKNDSSLLIDDVAEDEPMLTKQFSAGESTNAAGFYFLLNVLSRLGIANALQASVALIDNDFVLLILDYLATQAGITMNDPVAQTIRALRSQEVISYPSLLIPINAKSWPTNLRLPNQEALNIEVLVRVWALAVRRWCWRLGGLTTREIVNRSGRIFLTRADLDITLSLTSVDIRIRRVGLDIDPAWLPWFGRVVRFHYTQEDAGVFPC